MKAYPLSQNLTCLHPGGVCREAGKESIVVNAGSQSLFPSVACRGADWPLSGVSGVVDSGILHIKAGCNLFPGHYLNPCVELLL